jgi:hypothetical protein
MMNALRAELNAENVPIVVGLLGEFINAAHPFAPLVNEQLASLAAKSSLTGVASAHGLSHIGDKLHFDTPALRELGRRYAHVYLSLCPEWERNY